MNKLNEIYNSYKENHSLIRTPKNKVNSTTKKERTLMQRLLTKFTITDNNNNQSDEITKYFCSTPIVTFEQSFENQKTNKLLNWWNENKSDFPILSIIAKDYLSIMPTSVCSERHFSLSGLTIDILRSSLHPDSAQYLICQTAWNKIYKNFIN